MMRHNLEYAEFYINHTCNLNCEGCNRFNNYVFKGHKTWSECEDLYYQWAQRVKIDHISVLGGEPLMNPDLDNWLRGIRSCWPGTKLKLTTNGVKLMERYHSLVPIITDTLTRIEISVHNINWTSVFVDRLLNNKVGMVMINTNYHSKGNTQETVYEINRYQMLPESIRRTIDNGSANITVTVDNGEIIVDLNVAVHFHQSALIKENGRFTLHRSNPKHAIKTCDMKYSHHFIDGKLYKCGVTGVLPDFYQQYKKKFDLTNKQKLLVNGYRSIKIDDEDFDERIEELKQGNAIPQCSLCPENYEYRVLTSEVKKSKL